MLYIVFIDSSLNNFTYNTHNEVVKEKNVIERRRPKIYAYLRVYFEHTD